MPITCCDEEEGHQCEVREVGLRTPRTEMEEDGGYKHTEDSVPIHAVADIEDGYPSNTCVKLGRVGVVLATAP